MSNSEFEREVMLALGRIEQFMMNKEDADKCRDARISAVENRVQDIESSHTFYKGAAWVIGGVSAATFGSLAWFFNKFGEDITTVLKIHK